MTSIIPAWVDGTLTPVDKLDAHVRGLRHRAISVFLMRGDEVLLQRRALGKYHTPGLWANTCCTHPHWDEAPLACAERRLAQELGITGATLAYRDTVEYRADVGGGLIEHEVVDIFIGEMPTGARIAPNPDEVMDTIWRPLATLADEVAARPKGFTPWLAIYLRDHATAIFGDRVPA
ncbi:MAG: isopentenyl-diphosphate Delta-isomerase [Pseudomonadota bacterium]